MGLAQRANLLSSFNGTPMTTAWTEHGMPLRQAPGEPVLRDDRSDILSAVTTEEKEAS
jgi:hypothetical protein